MHYEYDFLIMFHVSIHSHVPFSYIINMNKHTKNNATMLIIYYIVIVIATLSLIVSTSAHASAWGPSPGLGARGVSLCAMKVALIKE